MAEGFESSFDADVSKEVARLTGGPRNYLSPRIDPVWFQAEVNDFEPSFVKSRGIPSFHRLQMID